MSNAAQPEAAAVRRERRAREDRPALNLGDLPGLLGYQLRRAQLAMFQDFAAAMGALDISPGQFGVLMIINANPGLNQSRLAGAMGIDRSTMVAVLDSLEGRGLLARKPSPTDRRSHALELTRKGTGLLREMRPVIDAHEDRIAHRLSGSERATLIALLSRFNGLE